MASNSELLEVAAGALTTTEHRDVRTDENRERLQHAFCQVVRFLSENPERSPQINKTQINNCSPVSYIPALAKKFLDGRKVIGLVETKTVPDEMVGYILKETQTLTDTETETWVSIHSKAMAAENLVGGLLERYLSTILEPRRWIWCSGSVVKACDFLLPPDVGVYAGAWRLLQVKNRDNSENSSSSAIREGTDIEKWFRSFSKKRATNWGAFPGDDAKALVSEEGFRNFVREYLSKQT